jgi:ABC-type transporter Mla subunit MlaD
VFQALRTSLNNPQGVGRTIEALSPALRIIGQGVEPVRGQVRGDLQRLVTATSKTVAGLADASALRALVHGGNQTLAVTTARRRELGELLELSPGALDSTFTTMRRLRTTLGHLDPLVTQLRPGARALSPAARAATPALRQTEALLREARPLLRAAGPTFDALKGAGVSGVPLMRELEPTLTRLDKELIPYLNEREPETRLLNYQTIGPFFASLDAAAAEFDREGYRIRLTVPPSNSSSLAMAPIQTNMARACMSVRPNSSDACGKAAQLLSRALFGMPKGAKR